MRGRVLNLVLVAILLAVALSGSPVVAQDSYFLRITSPEDMGKFATGVTSKITGLLELPDTRTNKQSLFLRFRLFVPDDKAFVIVNEAIVQVKNPPKGKNIVSFQQSMKLPDESGQYLLRVDCLDFEGPAYPRNLLATSSLFINLQKRELPKGEHNTVTIKTPASGDTYKTGSTIVVGGTSTMMNVVTIRVRVLQAGLIVQEALFPVNKGGSFSGNLTPPTGGWSVGNAAIEAQGLDACSNPVTGEINTVTIVIKK